MPGVRIGNECQGGKGHVQLGGQHRLRVLGHADEVGTRLQKRSGLGAGGETRAVDDRHRGSGHEALAQHFKGVNQQPAHCLAIGIRGGQVLYTRCGRAVVERVRAPPRPVQELVGDGKTSGFVGHRQPPYRRAGNDGLHPQALERPEVGAVVDLLWRHVVSVSVPAEEGDHCAKAVAPVCRHGGGKPGNGEGTGRQPKGCLNLQCLQNEGTGQVVQAGAANDADVGAVFQATRHGTIIPRGVRGVAGKVLTGPEHPRRFCSDTPLLPDGMRTILDALRWILRGGTPRSLFSGQAHAPWLWEKVSYGTLLATSASTLPPSGIASRVCLLRWQSPSSR